MGRPRRYREPIKGPFDFLARAWSKDAQVRARRGNRKAFWWISNLWYKPAHLLMVIGAVLAILLLLGEGAVWGGGCIRGVGCVAWDEGGIVAAPGGDAVVAVGPAD